MTHTKRMQHRRHERLKHAHVTSTHRRGSSAIHRMDPQVKALAAARLTRVLDEGLEGAYS